MEAETGQASPSLDDGVTDSSNVLAEGSEDGNSLKSTGDPVAFPIDLEPKDVANTEETDSRGSWNGGQALENKAIGAGEGESQEIGADLDDQTALETAMETDEHPDIGLDPSECLQVEEQDETAKELDLDEIVDTDVVGESDIQTGEKVKDVDDAVDTGNKSQDDEDADMPVIRVKQAGLFAEEDEEEEEEEEETLPNPETQSEASDAIESKRPRRESEDFASVSETTAANQSATVQDLTGTFVGEQKCAACQKLSSPVVKLSKVGEDLYFCSQFCFTNHKTPDVVRKSLPCAKCGIVKREGQSKSMYFWETMNFCSELCVGSFLVEIGSKCAFCSKVVAWECLGKYCVRFGNDVRQFCTAACLDRYKKEARICFHCQLDIKKLTNVVLANLPGKALPKEFCSQDCVESYIDQHYQQLQSQRQKPAKIAPCVICGSEREVFRDLVLGGTQWKLCSFGCWQQLLSKKQVRRPHICEICPKYLSVDSGALSAQNCVITPKRLYVFCSPTCKNVFVLRSRKIFSCGMCKVKKYNYDLMEYIEHGASAFAVCSLNCIPKPSQYLINLKETLTPPATSASEMVARSRENESLFGKHSDIKGGGPEPQVSRVSDLEMKNLIRTVESFLVFPPVKPVQKRNKGCSARPLTKNQSSEVYIPMEGEPPLRIEYRPIFVPYFVPFPFYAMDTPVPVPFPVPVPVPIPIPVILDGKEKSTTDEVTSNSFSSVPRAAIDVVSDVDVMPNPGGVTGIGLTPHAPTQVPDYMPVPNHTLCPGDGYNMMNPIANLGASISGSSSPLLGVTSNMQTLPAPMSGVYGVHNSGPSLSYDNNPWLMSQTAQANKPSFETEPGSPQYALSIWTQQLGGGLNPAHIAKPLLVEKLVQLVGTPQTGIPLNINNLTYVVLGLQMYLRSFDRIDRIFYDLDYEPFVIAFTNAVEFICSQAYVPPPGVDEAYLWKCSELGVASPEVLLFTLVYYNYKYFNLRTWQEHEALQITQYFVKTNTDLQGRQYKTLSLIGCPTGNNMEVVETQPSERCFVKLFEFYQYKSTVTAGSFYKCSIQNGAYLQKWYTASPLPKIHIYRYLCRAMMIKHNGV